MLLNSVPADRIKDYAATKEFDFINQFFQKDDEMYSNLKWKVAMEYGRVAGIIGYKQVDHTLVIMVFCVNSKMRGHKIGSDMLREFEVMVTSYGYIKKVSLIAYDDDAKNFWLKNGYNIEESFIDMVMLYKNFDD